MASKSKTTTADQDQVLFNIQEAAEYLNVADTYVPVLAKKDDVLGAGVIRDTYPGSKIKRVRISKEACDAWLAANKNGMNHRSGKRRLAIRFQNQAQIDQVSNFLETLGLELEPVYKKPENTTSNTNGSEPAASTEPTSDNDHDDTAFPPNSNNDLSDTYRANQDDQYQPSFA